MCHGLVGMGVFGQRVKTPSWRLFPTLMILGTERKREGTEAATTYQAETKPEVNFGGFSHGYGPLCIISASCAAASMLILKTGKHHRHTKKEKKNQTNLEAEALSDSITCFEIQYQQYLTACAGG